MSMIDLTGKRVGHMEVIGFGSKRKRPGGSFSYEWLCKCDCGKEFAADGTCIRRGSATSCGCMSVHAGQTHGMTSHPLYAVWCGMKQRCYGKNHKNYAEYGGRGITICDRWRDSFENFYADMGDRPTPRHTIERNDNDGMYEKDNCRWATRAEQTENQRSTKLLALKGEVLSISKWARRLGIPRRTIGRRLAAGWTVEQALLTPAGPGHNQFTRRQSA